MPQGGMLRKPAPDVRSVVLIMINVQVAYDTTVL